MKHLLSTVTAASAVVLSLLAGNADAADRAGARGHTSDFVGLWEGVDPLDGSLTQRSITCDRDGQCSVLGSDSFWVACGNPRGILVGEGMIEDGALEVPGFTLTCTGGPQLSVETRFVPDRRNRTLLEEHPNGEIPTFSFHRLSR